MLLLANSNSAVWYVILAHIVIMIGAPVAMSPTQTFGLNALDARTAGDGSTIMNTFQQIIGAISTAVATSLLGLGQHASSAPLNSQNAFTNGVHYGLIFPLALAVIAFLLSFTINDKSESK